MSDAAEAIAMTSLSLNDNPALASPEPPDLAFSPESVSSSAMLAIITPPPQPVATLPDLQPFKAKPAPKSSNAINVGPKLSKAAALRMGVTITPVKADSSTLRGTPTTRDEDTPGYKRTGLKLNVKSLASPSVLPRQTRASMIRCGQVPASSPVKASSVSAAVDAQRRAEVATRRKTLTLPASLAAPSIETPRPTKSSVLRTGGGNASAPSETPRKPFSEMTAEEKAERNTRMFAGVPGPRQTSSISAVPKSLAQPGVTPRLNRAAMLRTAPSPAVLSRANTQESATPPRTSIVKTALTTNAGRLAHVRTQSVPSTMPRPTKASLLRLQNGGKA